MSTDGVGPCHAHAFARRRRSSPPAAGSGSCCRTASRTCCVLRPLGGADDEIAGVFPDLEPVDPATFPPPDADDLGDAAGRRPAAHRAADRVPVQRRARSAPWPASPSNPAPYQLVPLLMALRQDTVRLLIADDVGIGKTIEAGLIAAELLAQGEAQRPRGALLAGAGRAVAGRAAHQVRHRRRAGARLARSRAWSAASRYGESLFDRTRTVVVSTDFIKSPRHRDDFVAHCPDLVIVDEAHTCVPPTAPAASAPAPAALRAAVAGSPTTRAGT